MVARNKLYTVYLPPHVFVAKTHKPIAKLNQVFKLLISCNLILSLYCEKCSRNRLQFSFETESSFVIQQLQLLNNIFHNQAGVNERLNFTSVIILVAVNGSHLRNLTLMTVDLAWSAATRRRVR